MAPREWRTAAFAELNAPLASVLGEQAKLFEALRVHTLGDLLRHLPRHYLSGTELTDLAILLAAPIVAVAMVGIDRFFYGRNEAAGVTYTIDATNWEDPRVPALIENIVCTASGTDNKEPLWPWEGEAISFDSMSQMVGTYTVTADFVPMSEALTTFETFNHEVEVIGDKVYLLSDYVLREYAIEGAGLTFIREIPLDGEYKNVENSNGTLVLSNFMKPVIGHDGEAAVFSYEGPDQFTLAPDGTWGISWFSSGDSTEKYTFKDGALVGEPLPFNEVKTISQVDVDDQYIYVSGSPVEGSGHTVFVYDHSGALQMQLKGDPNASIGLGSVTYITRTANGFLALDGNMRDVVLWTADGTWLGAIDGDDIFGTMNSIFYALHVTFYESVGSIFHVAYLSEHNHCCERFQSVFASNLCTCSALRFIGQINIFQYITFPACIDAFLQFIGELALFFNLF